MYKKTFNTIELFQFDRLSKYNEIVHYVSSRVASEKLGEFNLSYKVGKSEEVKSHRALLANNLGIEEHCLVFPDQTHSTNVKVVHNCDDLVLADTDAMVTAAPGICISVMSADCVPILLYDPIKNVAAAIHSGWRGTVGKIASKTLQVMLDEFSCDPRDVVASIGPSICPDVYEVGEEVITLTKKSFPYFYEKVLIHKDNKVFFDLWKANVLQLIELGVPASSIEVAAVCTFKENADFFSARKEGLSTGRFAAGILLR